LQAWLAKYGERLCLLFVALLASVNSVIKLRHNTVQPAWLPIYLPFI